MGPVVLSRHPTSLRVRVTGYSGQYEVPAARLVVAVDGAITAAPIAWPAQGAVTPDSPAPTVEHVIRGLTAGREYRVCVGLCVGGGPGEGGGGVVVWSEECVVGTLAPPGPPPAPEVLGDPGA